MKTKNITISLIFSLLILTISLQADNDSYFGEVRGNAEDAVYTIYIDPSGFEIGDEVAVFDGSKLVGATTIVSENAFENFIPVFATLNTGQGYQPGNAISLRIWHKDEMRETRDVSFSFEAITPEAHTSTVFPYENAAYSLAKLQEDAMQSAVSFQLYPNPASQNVSLLSNEAITEVELRSSLGQLIRAFEDNRNQIQLDISNLRQGVYILRAKIGSEHITHRLIVR